MYGLLLESIRFHIKQKYGQEAWELICKQCGLPSSSFTSGNSYSDTLIPKFSEACSKVLPYGRSSDCYMENFGNGFVIFTSALGYSNVLKVFSRSFRDFLDNIDSLHEHLRFGFPRLQSPSFECTEESRDGLTLHYRSRRYGFKNYVIGQVKEVAKLYFDIEIEVIVLDEADVVTSLGVRLCHITYRVIFDNNSFVPLVKEHRYLNSMSVPVDLIFKISPFSFLINKDLQIFRASNDLNQYFGENMAGKKILQIFAVRRPPIELTWETLINHGRVIFELVARQASNISLFTDASNNDTAELSARKLEWIDRLQKMDGSTPNLAKLRQNSKSASFTSSSFDDLNESIVKSKDGKRERKRSSKVEQVPEKPSRGIAMIRRRSCSMQIQGMLSREGSSSNDAINKPEVLLDDSYAHCPAKDLCTEKTGPKAIHWMDDSKDIVATEHSAGYKRISRPEPIGKHHDLSPSNSGQRVHASTSCPNIDVQGPGEWDSLSGLHRPEPIGQEDVARIPDVIPTVIVPSSSKDTTEVDRATDLHQDKQKGKGKGKSIREEQSSSSQEISRSGKSWQKRKSLSSRFFRKKVADAPSDVMAKPDDGVERFTAENSRSHAGNIKEDIQILGSRDSVHLEALCRSALFRRLRQGLARITQACSPLFHARNFKVASVRDGSPDSARSQKSDPIRMSEMERKVVPRSSYSEPLTRKPLQNRISDVSRAPSSRAGSDVSRRILMLDGSGRQRSIDEDQMGEKRKKVELWLQRQQCRPLHLRGQIKYISSWNMVLFIGTPIIGTVDDLKSSGLYLSDLSMHDGSRFLTMQGNQRLSEIEFACDREKLKRDLLEETTMQLEEEKQRTEEILYSMMPQEIAERMKNGDRELTTCETFDDVTILFGYVTDFTEICNKVEAMKVVKLVSEVFSLFDILSENHKVYKFETIGGGVYMLVSGVPVKINEHAQEMGLMALSMLEKIQTFVNPFTNKPLEIQIGIHSGPVVAGVIGQASLQYCLFGNTVNIASRMQTTGDKMKIHLSDTANKELEASGFITEYRGSVPVKGVGNLDTYWLIGRNDETSVKVSTQSMQNQEESIQSKQLITVNHVGSRPNSSLLLT